MDSSRRTPAALGSLGLRPSDDAFSQAYARAREIGPIAIADKAMDVTEADLLTHEDIGRARLRMQSAQWHTGLVFL